MFTESSPGCWAVLQLHCCLRKFTTKPSEQVAAPPSMYMVTCQVNCMLDRDKSLQGRMAMVDVLCDMKERALKEVNPHLLTIATLTGHAVLANGPYTNVMDNGPSKREAFAQSLQGRIVWK